MLACFCQHAEEQHELDGPCTACPCAMYVACEWAETTNGGDMKRAKRGSNVIGVPPQKVGRSHIVIRPDSGPSCTLTLWTTHSRPEIASAIRKACESLISGNGKRR